MTEMQVAEGPAKRKRKNPYIAHLAEFSFRPDQDWPVKKACEMFTQSAREDYDIIYFEDCIAGMRHLPSESVDLVVADPPFGLNFTGCEAIYNRVSDNVEKGYVDVNEEYGDFTSRWIAELPRLMCDHASAYIFSGWTNLKEVLCAIDDVGLKVKNHIIWKYQFGVFTTTKFVSCHYHVLFVVKDEQKYFFNRIQHYNEDVWTINRPYKAGQKKNGTKLPEAVIRKCIDFSSSPGDLVLDPFMGNGTTAVVARANFRHYLGFEINKRMHPCIESGLSAVQPGQAYLPYEDRLPSIDDLKKQYPAAYREFIKRQQAK